LSSARDVALRVQVEKLRELLRWRDYLPHLVEAVKRVLGEEARIYLTGSAVENRLTVDSDVDVWVVSRNIPRSALERAKVLDEIWRIMESLGVPWWYPFELLLLTEEELEILDKSKLVRIA